MLKGTELAMNSLLQSIFSPAYLSHTRVEFAEQAEQAHSGPDVLLLGSLVRTPLLGLVDSGGFPAWGMLTTPLPGKRLVPKPALSGNTA